VDEIYYTNQALGATGKESNKNFSQAKTVHISEDHDATFSDDDNDDDDDAACSSSTDSFDTTDPDLLEKTTTLFLNWPCSFTTSVS
jgi:hypothetical protein